jgi:hypothetical protein
VYDSLFAKFFSLGIQGIQNPVGVYDDGTARWHHNPTFLKSRVGKHADREIAVWQPGYLATGRYE